MAYIGHIILVLFTLMIGFVMWAMLIQITKWVYKISLNFDQKFRNSLFTRALAYFLGSMGINPIGMWMLVLVWDKSVQFYADMNFIFPILLSGCLVLSLVIKPKKPRSQEK